MQRAMRVPILLACSVFLINGIHAEALSDADREALLGNLEKLKENVESKSDARIRTAIAAFRSAMGSDEAAKELYLNCTKRVNFEEQQRKAQDFREWERREGERIGDPGFAGALRLQLRWLVLTLEAAPERADRTKLTGEAQQIVDSIFSNADKLKGQEGTLSQPVMGTVFARAYDVGHVKVENWPMSPVQLETVYSQLLLPPLRRPSALPELRAAWIRRIQQESAKAEHWPPVQQGRDQRGERDDRRGGGTDPAQAAAFTKFLEETQPKLQWEMEVDLFRNGDESGAAMRMLAHLQKYMAHPSAPEWGQQFKDLLKPKAAPAPAKATDDPAP